MRLPCYRFWGMGDYYYKRGELNFDICGRNLNEKIEILVHELIEFYGIRKARIKIKDIDEFDVNFKGDDPGSNNNSPYRKQHLFALKVGDKLNKL